MDSRGSEAEEANGAGKADEDMDTVQPSVLEPGKGASSPTASVVNRGGVGGIDNAVHPKADQAEEVVSRDFARPQPDSETISPVLPGEYDRVKAFYEKNGYLSAPRQSKEATLRRLQAM